MLLLGGHGAYLARVSRRYPMASLARSSFLVFSSVFVPLFSLEHCFFFQPFCELIPYYNTEELLLLHAVDYTFLTGIRCLVNGTPRGARYPGVCLSSCSHHGSL